MNNLFLDERQSRNRLTDDEEEIRLEVVEVFIFSLAGKLFQRVGRGFLLRKAQAQWHRRKHRAVLSLSTSKELEKHVSVLQRSWRCHAASLVVEHKKSLAFLVHLAARTIQSLVRGRLARAMYSESFSESRRKRHERLLSQYLERKIRAPLLRRVVKKVTADERERKVCRTILQNSLDYASACQSVGEIARPTPRIDATRETTFSEFCNARFVSGLLEEDVSDSSDDSIDEQLLKPTKPNM